jgi:hypothetical protein
MHSVKVQKAVIDVLDYGALKTLSSAWHQELVSIPSRPCQDRPRDLEQIRHHANEMAAHLQTRTRVLSPQTVKATVFNEKRDDEDQNGECTQVSRRHLLFLCRRL